MSDEQPAPYGSGAQQAAPAPTKRVRTHHLRDFKERGEKFTMLTAYEQYAAATFDEAGIDVLLVGDSASNNVYGNETSLPVTVDELIPLTRAVSRSVRRSLVVGDLPFGSYQASPEQAYLTASPSWPTSASRRRASTRWAATACRVVVTLPTGCCPTPMRSRAPVRSRS
jgi:3-methyl-2-oxobutanoate hydroxymethyltransferase